MISQSELKYYSSLLVKKFRNKENKFIVEGSKIVEEGLLSNYICEAIFVTSAFLDLHPEIIEQTKTKKLVQLKSLEFQKLSDTRTPQGVAAVFNKNYPKKDINEVIENFIVLIDNVSDPGNLGTILRTCDWFGINTVLISNQSVEYLNPKVIRSSMGSIFHLNIYEEFDLNKLEVMKKRNYKIICSDLQGKNINDFQFQNKSIIVFSNESLGPSEIIKSLADELVTIPKKGKAESLNVSSAAAIILSNI
jgi:TrmH family RNA methyltransferase